MLVEKKVKNAWDLEPDPVWLIEKGKIKPSPFFLRWWQTVAERKFGDKDKWIDAAMLLGYLAKLFDPETGKTYVEAVGFDYDPIAARKSLGISNSMPLIFNNSKDKSYERLWDYLSREVSDEQGRSHLG